MASIIARIIYKTSIFIRKKNKSRETRKEQKRTERNCPGFKAYGKKRLPQVCSGEHASLNLRETWKVSAQRQSPFFKLPAEIRICIYQYALGGEHLSIGLVGRSGSRDDLLRLECSRPHQLLALPKSCKLAYIEAIEYIYTANTFHISCITDDICLQCLLSARFFDSIQTIYLWWIHQNFAQSVGILGGMPPYDILSWKHTWREISKMKGLKLVRLEMNVSSQEMRSSMIAHENRWFSPLEAVHAQGVDTIVLVDWYEEDCHWSQRPDERKVWPFKIYRGRIVCRGPPRRGIRFWRY